MTAGRYGKAIMVLILLLNVPVFLLVPWDKVLFDREEVVRRNTGRTVSVRVSDLEPTGVYVPMDGGNSHITGYEDPKWIHRLAYAYAQFYLYYGDDVPENTKLYSFRTLDDDEPWVILIADSIIDIPDSGKVELDLSSVNEYRWAVAENALEEVNDEYDISQNTYIDCATPYCGELQAFKNKQKMYCFIVTAAECLLLPVVLFVIVIVQKRKEEQR